MGLRLGFHYHVPVYQDALGGLRTPGYQGRFVDALAAECEQLVCFLHSPRSDEVPYMDYELRAPNLTWVDMGPHVSVPKRMLSARRLAKRLTPWRSRLDALLLRGPSPLLPIAAGAIAPLPVALLLVGDYLAGVDDLPQPRWRKEMIRLWAHWYSREQRIVARRALTLVNSRRLYDAFKPHAGAIDEIRTATLTTADFWHRDDTCRGRPIRLLYTGRFDRGKGLSIMVEALAKLVQAGEDVVLDLAGWSPRGEAALSEARRAAEAQSLGERVFYQGYRALGPDLFALYKQADIYLSASMETEGFPRGIWEAMAHCLPVVATTVGSIPCLLRDGHSATLVAPRNSEALARGVMEVIHNHQMRQATIRAGYRLAAQNTLEASVADLTAKLNSWLASKALRKTA